MATSPSGGGLTVVATAPELFSSLGSVGALTVATFVNVVFAAASDGMWKVMVKLAVVPAAMLAAVQVTAPLVAPAPGVMQLKPAGGVTETKLHPPLMVSVSVTVPEALGPVLVTSMVYVTSLFAGAVPGPALVMVRSLTCAYAAGARTSIAHTTA